MSHNNAVPPLARPPSSQASNAGNGIDGDGGNGAGGGNASTATTTAASTGDDGDAHSCPTIGTTPNTPPNLVTRVHDHNRPFPPPRLAVGHVALAPPSPTPAIVTTASLPTPGGAREPGAVVVPPRIPLTAPLTPLSSSSFRSRPSLRQVTNDGPITDSTRSGGSLLSTADPVAPPPPRSPVGEVSLTVPRPDGERTINEYVEAPFKHCCNNQQVSSLRHHHDLENKRGTTAAAGGAIDCPKIERTSRRHKALGGSKANPSLPATHNRTQRLVGRSQPFRGFGPTTGNVAAPGVVLPATSPTSPTSAAVTKQPVSFTKEPANVLGSRGAGYDPAGLSIMCDFCGRCRCESCREPPPLPSRWLCDNSCFCSAETILDYSSCLCCVKGLFYHCVDSGGGGIDAEQAAGGNCADEPCSCTGSRRASRWACLGALTLVMPCLLCYWPFKGCVALCEACYARHAAQGCRCNPNTGTGVGGNDGTPGRHHSISNEIGDSRDPEKRLLDPVTPEL